MLVIAPCRYLFTFETGKKYKRQFHTSIFPAQRIPDIRHTRAQHHSCRTKRCPVVTVPAPHLRRCGLDRIARGRNTSPAVRPERGIPDVAGDRHHTDRHMGMLSSEAQTPDFRQNHNRMAGHASPSVEVDTSTDPVEITTVQKMLSATSGSLITGLLGMSPHPYTCDERH